MNVLRSITKVIRFDSRKFCVLSRTRKLRLISDYAKVLHFLANFSLLTNLYYRKERVCSPMKRFISRELHGKYFISQTIISSMTFRTIWNGYMYIYTYFHINDFFTNLNPLLTIYLLNWIHEQIWKWLNCCKPIGNACLILYGIAGHLFFM